MSAPPPTHSTPPPPPSPEQQRQQPGPFLPQHSALHMDSSAETAHLDSMRQLMDEMTAATQHSWFNGENDEKAYVAKPAAATDDEFEDPLASEQTPSKKARSE